MLDCVTINLKYKRLLEKEVIEREYRIDKLMNCLKNEQELIHSLQKYKEILGSAEVEEEDIYDARHELARCVDDISSDMSALLYSYGNNGLSIMCGYSKMSENDREKGLETVGEYLDLVAKIFKLYADFILKHGTNKELLLLAAGQETIQERLNDIGKIEEEQISKIRGVIPHENDADSYDLRERFPYLALLDNEGSIVDQNQDISDELCSFDDDNSCTSSVENIEKKNSHAGRKKAKTIMPVTKAQLRKMCEMRCEGKSMIYIARHNKMSKDKARDILKLLNYSEETINKLRKTMNSMGYDVIDGEIVKLDN